MSAEENKTLFRHVLEEVWGGNIAILNDHPGMHETIPFVTALHEANPNAKQEIAQQLTDGDWVITRFLSSGVLVKDFRGMTAGAQIDTETIMLLLVHDGKIVEQHSQAGRNG